MGQQTEEYNEWAEHSLEELYDCLFNAQERLHRIEDNEDFRYDPHRSDSYMSALSQAYAKQSCKENISAIRSEIDRRSGEEADEMAEDTTRD